MVHSPMQPDESGEIPLLTEMVDADTTDIPTLTEVVTAAPQPSIAPHAEYAPWSDAQCQQLAAQITLQLETQLRKKFAPHFNALLQDALLDAQSSMPALIRAALSGEPPAASVQSAKITPSAVTPNLN